MNNEINGLNLLNGTQPIRLRSDDKTPATSVENNAPSKVVQPIQAEDAKSLKQIFTPLSTRSKKILGHFFDGNHMSADKKQAYTDWLMREIEKSPLLVSAINQAVGSGRLTSFRSESLESEGLDGKYDIKTGRIIIDSDSVDSAYLNRGSDIYFPLTVIGTIGHEVYHALTQSQMIQCDDNLRAGIVNSQVRGLDFTSPVAKYTECDLKSEANAEKFGYDCVNSYLLTVKPQSTVQERLGIVNAVTMGVVTPPVELGRNINNELTITNYRPELYDAQGFTLPSAQNHYVKQFALANGYREHAIAYGTTLFKTPNNELNLALLGTNESQLKENLGYFFNARGLKPFVDSSDPNQPCKIDLKQKNKLSCGVKSGAEVSAELGLTPSPELDAYFANIAPKPQLVNTPASSSAASYQSIVDEVIQKFSKDPSLHQVSDGRNR